MVLPRRIRLWLHVCICGGFHYVCTAAGLMSAEIQAETRALQVARHHKTSSYSSYQEASSADGVDSSDKTLAAREHLRLLLLRLYGYGAHVCRNPGRGAQSVTGIARASVAPYTSPTAGLEKAAYHLRISFWLRAIDYH